MPYLQLIGAETAERGVCRSTAVTRSAADSGTPGKGVNHHWLKEAPYIRGKRKKK